MPFSAEARAEFSFLSSGPCESQEQDDKIPKVELHSAYPCPLPAKAGRP